MPNPLERTMEQYLTEQYLARIGYVSGPEQQIPEPDPNLRPDIRLTTIEEVQAKILNQLKEQHAAQEQAPATISSRPATQTRTPDLREEAASPIIIPDAPSTASTPGTEISYQPLESRHELKSASPPPPPLPTRAEIVAGLYSKLDCRQKTCLGIERQLKACQKEIRTHPSKRHKIEKEHDKRIAEVMKPVHDEKPKAVDAEKRQDAQTAEEAEIEEMRNIYLQYDRELIGVPNAGSVDALFVVIGNTEDRLKKAEEVNKAAKRREGKLEEKLYRARCAMFEMEDEIEEVENGGLAKEAGELEVEKSRIEGHKEGKGKGKVRLRKGVKDRQQGKGEGSDKKVGRRRKRRRNTSGKAGKMSSDTALDS